MLLCLQLRRPTQLLRHRAWRPRMGGNTPHGGSTPRIRSNSGSETTTPRAHTDLTPTQKKEELLDAYRRVADLQAEKSRLEAVALRVPRQVAREAQPQVAGVPRELLQPKLPPLYSPRNKGRPEGASAT